MHKAYYQKNFTQLIIKKNRDIILQRAKNYYSNNIKILRERARNKYRELPEEEKKNRICKKQIS